MIRSGQFLEDMKQKRFMTRCNNFRTKGHQIKGALISLVFLIICFYPYIALSAEKKVATIIAVPPEVALLTRFIGGPVVEVLSYLDWTEDGTLVVHTKTFPKDTILIALTPKEKKIPKGISQVKYLYEFLPQGREEFDKYFFDPASLFFMASRVLIALTELDPSMYDYFQRRLAEFQSRLDSVVNVGREILSGVSMLDLSGRMEFLLKASSARVKRPSQEWFDLWEKGEGSEELVKCMERAKSQNTLVVADAWSPKIIKDEVSNLSCGILLPAPKLDDMWTSYLHDLYLALWNRFKAVP